MLDSGSKQECPRWHEPNPEMTQRNPPAAWNRSPGACASKAGDLHNTGINMSESLLRLPAVIARVSLSRTMLYLLMQQGKFPKPIQLTGNRAVAWTASSIDNWIAQRIKAAKRGSC